MLLDMKTPYRLIAASIAAATLSGCGILYTNVHTPRAYRTATPSEVKSTPQDEMASGKACAHSFLYLFAWGDGGYAAAARDALQGKPDSMLYDVKSDMHVQAYVLGLYTKVCTILTGKVAKP